MSKLPCMKYAQYYLAEISLVSNASLVIFVFANLCCLNACFYTRLKISRSLASNETSCFFERSEETHAWQKTTKPCCNIFCLEQSIAKLWLKRIRPVGDLVFHYTDCVCQLNCLATYRRKETRCHALYCWHCWNQVWMSWCCQLAVTSIQDARTSQALRWSVSSALTLRFPFTTKGSRHERSVGSSGKEHIGQSYTSLNVKGMVIFWMIKSRRVELFEVFVLVFRPWQVWEYSRMKDSNK